MKLNPTFCRLNKEQASIFVGFPKNARIFFLFCKGFSSEDQYPHWVLEEAWKIMTIANEFIFGLLFAKKTYTKISIANSLKTVLGDYANKGFLKLLFL